MDNENLKDESQEVDLDRRKFLLSATAALGAIGLGCAGVPFVKSWLPSSRAQALGGSVEVDISKIPLNEKITVAWRSQPVFIVHRSKEILDVLAAQPDKDLRDPLSENSVQPKYIKQKFRAIKDEYLVIVGICTHLGCVPLYKPEAKSVDANWTGGFFCPCHGSKFDLAGRVLKNVPAPSNLHIPPHKYINDKTLLIGED